MRSAIHLLTGALFGAGLVVAGMTNPAKVVGFLDPFGAWDPSLAFVMGGAMLVFGVGRPLVLRRAAPLAGGSFPPAPASRIDGRLLLGAGLFGVGWGLVGFCPGPALANLGALRPEAALFVAVMAAGMVVAQRVFGADRAAPAAPQRRRQRAA